MSISGVGEAGQGVWTTRGGPSGGSNTYALASDPSNPATIYAGMAGKKILRSTDAGTTWAAAGTGLTNHDARTLAVSPSVPRVLYAATWDGGVFKSTDSGGTWAVANIGLTNLAVHAFVIDASSSDTLYAGTSGGGVFKSTDSGGTWAAANTGLTNLTVNALAINPAAPGTLFAATDGGGVFRSTDSGATWIAANTGLWAHTIRALATNPATPATLYAGAGFSGVFRSTDSGATWTAAHTGLTGIDVLILGTDPSSPAALYAGTSGKGVCRSTDSGRTWAVASTGLPELTTVDALIVDSTLPGTLHVGLEAAIGSGTSGGVFRSSDSGSTWTVANAGLTYLDTSVLAIDPSNRTTVYAVTDENNLFKSTDTGGTWIAKGPRGRVTGLVIDPSRPTILYAAGGGVLRSTDAGDTWAASSQDLRPYWPAVLALDPITPSTLYAGTWFSNTGILKSTDSGGTWTVARAGPPETNVTALAINPSNPGTLYAGMAFGEGVFKSTDAGITWAAANAGIAWNSSTVDSLLVDPLAPDTLFAGSSWGVYKSTNAGGSWISANRGFVNGGVDALAICPATPTTLYAGNDGVFRSTDAGGIWAAASKGLPSSEVTALAIDPIEATVYAALRGGGVWQASGKSVIPVALDVDNGSAHYTTELDLSNAAASPQNVALTYTPSLGTNAGGGKVSVSLPAGQQVVYPNIITALRALGLSIPAASPSAPQGGTLAVTYAPGVGGVYATARTTTATAAPQPVGSAGLAYGGLPATEAITTRGVVYGLRSTDADRSNLAVYNTGSDPVTVKVTLFSGSGDGRSAVVSDGVTLPAFGWYQFDRVLAGVGMTNAWALLERTSAAGAFGAYGVINDNKTNDGSFVELVSRSTNGSGLTLPVLVEAGAFTSEIVLANKGTTVAQLTLNYVESNSPGFGAGGIVNVSLSPGEQRIVAGGIDFLRTHGAAIGSKGAAGYAGAVRVGVTGASLADVYAGARTASASSAAVGGQFGLFTPPVYSGETASGSASIYGLKADALTRTNVAVLNAGADGSGSVTLRLDIHDGSEGGAVKATQTLTLNPGQWVQPNGFFGGSGVANGYVTVTRTSGAAPWIAYGVVNDGGGPGQGTGDGAYVPMVR